MSFILGFGETEIRVAGELIQECAEAIRENPDFARDAVRRVEDKYHAEEKRLSAMTRDEAPERYTHFYANCYDLYAGKFVVTFTMNHINRRHALSLDGWALWQTKWVLITDTEDDDEIYQQV